MEHKTYIKLFFTFTLLSVSTLFASRYPRDYVRWTRILQKGSMDVLRTKETLMNDSKQLKDLEHLAVIAGEKRLSSVRSKLSRSIANVEGDVLNLNVKSILNAMIDVPLRENRLIHKIQQAKRDLKDGCVIRIAKYCAERCNHLLQGNHSRDWTLFDCDFAKPCRIETRFMGRLTSDVMQSVDVLLIVDSLHDGLQLKTLMDIRPPGQLWVLYSRENPMHDAEYAPEGLIGNPFNLTMTYSRDSDIYFPYCTLQKERVRSPHLPKKTKLIAWMASNCHRLSWRRGEFVKELQRHISVDTYGKCGDKGHLSSQEASETLSQYKFYLAFESSECRDYISEKLWRTCLLQGIVPIVYGAKREDYEQLVPRNSFIYLEDFTNMSAFVDYIYALDADEARYKKYFDWRKEGTVHCLSARTFIMYTPEVNLCYLLRKLIHLHIHPEISWQKKTPDFASWWRGQCLNSTVEKNVLGFHVHQPKIKKGKPSR